MKILDAMQAQEVPWLTGYLKSHIKLCDDFVQD